MSKSRFRWNRVAYKKCVSESRGRDIYHQLLYPYPFWEDFEHPRYQGQFYALFFAKYYWPRVREITHAKTQEKYLVSSQWNHCSNFARKILNSNRLRDGWCLQRRNSLFPTYPDKGYTRLMLMRKGIDEITIGASNIWKQTSLNSWWGKRSERKCFFEYAG